MVEGSESVQQIFALQKKCLRVYNRAVKRHRLLARAEGKPHHSNDAFSDEDEYNDAIDDEDDADDDEAASAAIDTPKEIEFEPKVLCSDDRRLLASRILLRRAKHSSFLRRHLVNLPASYVTLNASRNWIHYWIVHALALLDSWDPLEEDRSLTDNIIGFVKSTRCTKSGGYGGGPGQLGHLLPTYAAVSSLFELRSKAALESIDRSEIYRFLMSMKDAETGGYSVHEDGEIDVRGAYGAIAVASMLHIMTEELISGVPEYIGRLQNYDGGLGGEVGLESHGGYTYCGLAALCIMGKATDDILDIKKLQQWAVNRQSDVIGGFDGRPNKLTDSCYSFWCGATLRLLEKLQGLEGKDEGTLFDSPALQLYILSCCQDDDKDSVYSYKGGLRDKPGASQDLYHTCYAISGLSVAQHRASGSIDTVVGSDERINKVKATSLLYNITMDAMQFCSSVFGRPAQLY